MQIIKSKILDFNEIKNIIETIFCNNLFEISFGLSNLISLCKIIFEHEIYENFDLLNIQNFNSYSHSWIIYKIIFKKQKKNIDFIKSQISFLINNDICFHFKNEFNFINDKTFFTGINQLLKDEFSFSNHHQIKNMETFLQKFLISFIQNTYKIFQATSKIENRFISNELKFVHSNFSNLIKKALITNERIMFKEKNELFSNEKEEEEILFQIYIENLTKSFEITSQR